MGYSQSKTDYYFIRDTIVNKTDTAITISNFKTPEHNRLVLLSKNGVRKIGVKEFTLQPLYYEQTNFNMPTMLVALLSGIVCESYIESYNKIQKYDKNEAKPHMIRAIILGVVTAISIINISDTQVLQYYIPENKLLYKITF